MDWRSWPWKKKTAAKVVTSINSVNAPSSSLGDNQEDQCQDNGKSMDYVQITAERHAHLTGLEDQVKFLTEKLSSAESEITTKDNLVKQHAKVAEEAVSGWEKAEAEALALKDQLESLMLLKLTAEERVSQLNGALKECMKQMQLEREENEKKLQDIVHTKSKQWEKVQVELEAKILQFEQEIQWASAENATLSRSLQEHSDMLIKIGEDKSQANAEIELLKADIQSYEKQISSLKYELQIFSEELEIRSMEKNMSMRAAEAANKQHSEDAKKIMKLEAECQRLRGLVRKKLPGPAALAQMKLEVENLGQVQGENKLQRSPARNLSAHVRSASEFSLQNIQQCPRENQFFVSRLSTMEEEMKMLKESLSKRNIELQASRDMYAKTVNKLRSIESHALVMNQQKRPSKSNIDKFLEVSLSQNESNQSSCLASMSEDGIDEVGSCSESWAITSLPDLSQFKKDKNLSYLELMDDFLEMEKLAISSADTNKKAGSNNMIDKMILGSTDTALLVDDQDKSTREQSDPKPPTVLHSICEKKHAVKLALQRKDALLSELKTRIVSVLESQALAADVASLLEDIKHILQDAQETFHHHTIDRTSEETHIRDSICEKECCLQDVGETTDAGILLKQGTDLCTGARNAISEELENAIIQIRLFIVSLGKEAMEIQGWSSRDHDQGDKIEEFAAFVDKVLSKEATLDEFIFTLSHALSDIRKQNCKGSDGENNNDCIDKVTLLEKKIAQHDPRQERLSENTLNSPSASVPEIFQELNTPNFEQKAPLLKFSLEEFKQLKQKKDSMEMDLVRCTETLDKTKFQLVETVERLEVLKSELAACRKSNSLTETQLKCMVESYNSLESRSQELEAELIELRTKAETLHIELQEEQRNHQDDLAKCKELQKRIDRQERCSRCMCHSGADVDSSKQRREIAAAAEKLAECQETIVLLSRQLKALRPSAECMSRSPGARHRISDILLDDEPNSGVMINLMQPSQSEKDNVASPSQITCSDSHSDGQSSNLSSYATGLSLNPGSSGGSRRPKQRSRSSSLSSFSRIFRKRKE